MGTTKAQDKKFQDILDKLSDALETYKKLLGQAEEEYKKRFGKYPSDIYDDFWIDTYHEAGGYKATVDEVTQHAKFAKSIN